MTEEAQDLLHRQAGRVRCRCCVHARVDDGYALCQHPRPRWGIPGQPLDHYAPCASFEDRGEPAQEPGEHIPECGGCPYYLDNPWTHYPELKGWCGYWWDYLTGPDNPMCKEWRRGELPVPVPTSRAQAMASTSHGHPGNLGLEHSAEQFAA